MLPQVITTDALLMSCAFLVISRTGVGNSPDVNINIYAAASCVIIRSEPAAASEDRQSK
jgi:hypothetical protein